MRALACIALVLVASPAWAEDSITLGSKPGKVGSKVIVEKSSTMTMKVTAKGQDVPVTQTTVEKKQIELLAVDATTVRKAKISYLEDTKIEKVGAKTKPPRLSLAGKTFTISAGTPPVVEEHGKPAAAAVADEVRKREKRFGQPDRMKVALAGKKFVKDRPVDLSGADILIDDDSSIEVTKITFTYRGKVGANAKFTVRFLAKSKKPGTAMVMDLSGPAVVDPSTGDVLEIVMDGTVKDSSAIKIDGTLKMTERSIVQ